MPKVNFTISFVRNVACAKDKPKSVFFDEKCNGLMLEVRPTGGKTYYLRYRNNRGRTRLLKLADARDINVSQARYLASKAKTKIVLGEDPNEEKKQFRTTPTFKQFIDEQYLPYVQSYKKSWKSDDSYLRCQILPSFRNKYMDEINRHHITELLQLLRSKNYKEGTCNRSLVLLRYVFNLAIRWETPGVKCNPSKDVLLFDDVEGKRERFLTQTEMRRLMEAVNESENSDLKNIVAMLALTGARKREVLDARWEDVDMQNCQWKIPINKSGRPRYVPLSNSVIGLLATLKKGTSPYLFANPKTGKPYREIFKSWDTARKQAGLSDVRMHDLRHSFASFLVNAGRSLYEVQRILGHTQIKTTQRYAHLSQETLICAANTAAQAINI